MYNIEYDAKPTTTSIKWKVFKLSGGSGILCNIKVFHNKAENPYMYYCIIKLCHYRGCARYPRPYNSYR